MCFKHFFQKAANRILLLSLILFPVSAIANSFEEGKQAYLKKDYDTALAILRPLAENGNAKAQITLGLMYDYGHGVEKDPTESIKWYRMAAEQGEPLVQLDLGIKYFQGQGVKQNYQEAAKWWEMSANAGVADSQFNLGLMYYRGIGFDKDFEKASTLFEKAAEQGHGNAQYSLAVMYAFGQHKPKDYQTALEWFRKAAEQNVAQAQFNLGVFHENGYGVEKDFDQAHEFYVLAANQGLQEAIEKLRTFDKNALKKQAEKEAIVNKTETTPVTKTTSQASTDMEITSAPDNQMDFSGWLRQQPAETYTLQLGSVLNENDIINFIKDARLGNKLGYIKVVINGTNRYTAIYGLYTSYEEAQSAINELPNSIIKSKPWVRNTGILQGLLM